MAKSRSRVIAWIVLMVFGLVIFGTSVFILVHADHDHTGEDCPICMELAQCHKTLTTLETAVTGAIPLTLLFCIAAMIDGIMIKSCPAHTTLISLKVELLN